MYSSEDLARFYFQYQTEALPHGESLQSFCVKHNVPYNIFQKLFKDTRKKVVEVQIDGVPVINHEKKSKTSNQPIVMSRNRRIVRMFSFDNHMVIGMPTVTGDMPGIIWNACG